MKKIAVIISGADTKSRRGIMDIALTRIENIQKYNDICFDIYAIRCEYRDFTPMCLIKGEHLISKTYIGNKAINLLTKIEYKSNKRIYRKGLKLYHKWSHTRLQDWEWHKSFSKYFKEYDAITAHFNDAAIIAESAHEKYEIPFFVIWHGSDIHTIPLNDINARKKTINAIEKASNNFFVSQALLQESDKLTIYGKKDVLYNGVSPIFTRYTNIQRLNLRKSLGINHGKVVTFAGNLRPIKNADLLPNIFSLVASKYEGIVTFFIIGDGELHQEIKEKMYGNHINCIFWGQQPAERMPDFFNCTDVLILPSKNEGLPLVTLEAIACGANVIGSMVGGIPESIGIEYCIPIEDDFVTKISNAVVECLYHPCVQSIRPEFNWEIIAEKEHKFYINALY